MIERLMITDSILNRIRSMVQDEAALTVETTLAALWPMLESMRVIELVVEIETAYGIALPDDLIGHGGELKTVGDLANAVWIKANNIDVSMRSGV